MNLNELKNSSILLLGKTRALNQEEFEKLLGIYNITCKDTVDKSVELVIEGAMMSPYHQNEQDRLYEKGYKFESIDTLEKALCSDINPDTLMMSLKLSNNQDRLLNFIKNPYIDDNFFLKLITLHDWRGESFFENDENRDVTAALIRRFYKNIERNHNVEYANTGLYHLLSQTKDTKLISTIASLEPIEYAVKKGSNDATHKILQALVLHQNCADEVLLKMIKYANIALLSLISSKEPLSEILQDKLMQIDESEVLKSLSTNSSLKPLHVRKFLEDEKYCENILLHVRLDRDIFDKFKAKYSYILAENENLHVSMQKELFNLEDKSLRVVLASNSSLSQELIDEFIELNDDEILKVLIKHQNLSSKQLSRFEDNEALHVSLASNKNTDTKLLQSLSSSKDSNVVLAVAKNPSTPLEILFELQLDARYKRAVHENRAFGEYIQKENMGWL